jgi:hypothetical protein
MSNLKVDGVEPNSTAAVTIGGTGNLTTAGSAGNLVVGGTATVGGTLTTNGTTDHNGDVDATGYTITADYVNAISGLQIDGSAISLTRGMTFLGIDNGTAVALRGANVGLIENGHAYDQSIYAESDVAWAGLASIKVSALLRSIHVGTSWTYAFQVLVGTTWITLGNTAAPLASSQSAAPTRSAFEIHNANFAANTTGLTSHYGISGDLQGASAVANGQIIGFRFMTQHSMDVKIQAWGISL